MPPRQKEEVLQYLHIPKTGTSLNWFLRDYFNFLSEEELKTNSMTDPCLNWLQTVGLIHKWIH